jgi:hypothetical protein
MPKETPRARLNWTLIALLVVLSFTILGNRNMPNDFIPQNVWFWTNTIVGFGVLFGVLVYLAYRLIKGWTGKPTETIPSGDGEEARISLKADTADIAKMNTEQIVAFRELLAKLPSEQPKEKGKKEALK